MKARRRKAIGACDNYEIGIKFDTTNKHEFKGRFLCKPIYTSGDRSKNSVDYVSYTYFNDYDFPAIVSEVYKFQNLFKK